VDPSTLKANPKISKTLKILPRTPIFAKEIKEIKKLAGIEKNAPLQPSPVARSS
jgi:hypothetical protein